MVSHSRAYHQYYLPVLLFFLSIFLFACGGGGSSEEEDSDANESVSVTIGPAGGEVSIASGSIKLEIPDGALNQDTTITIEHLKAAGTHSTLEQVADEGKGRVYRFGPDGLSFAKPVPFTAILKDISLQTVAGITDIPLIAAIAINASGIAEALANLEIEYDAETGDVLIKGELSHFSDLEIRPLKGASIIIEGVPETPIAPGTEFFVSAKVNTVGLAQESDVTAKYLDFSIPPVVHTGPTPATSNFKWSNLPYACIFPGNIGYYNSFIELTLKDGVEHWRIGSLENPVLIPKDYITPRFVFNRAVDCRPGKPKISYQFLNEPFTHEYALANLKIQLSESTDEDLEFTLNPRGNALYAEDWLFGPNGTDNHQQENGLMTPFKYAIRAGHDSLTLNIVGLDDADKDEGKSTTLFLTAPEDWAIDGDPNITIEWLDDVDDGTDPPTLNARGLEFVASPRNVLSYVGTTFSIHLEQNNSVFDGNSETRVVRADISMDDPDGILSGPQLGDYQQGDGTGQPSLLFNQEPGVHGLFIENSTVPSINKQRIMYGCLKVGNATVTLKAFLAIPPTQDYMPIGNLKISVACQENLAPSFVSAIVLTQMPGVFVTPEYFLGFLGPFIGLNYLPQGDPFPQQAATNRSSELLDLNPEHDYALIATDGDIRIHDLQTGEEEQRLRVPLEGNIGGTFLYSPDSNAGRPEWLAFYGDSAGYSMTRYVGDTKEWGITRYFNIGEVTDIIPGPADSNGRDTGFILTNAGQNLVIFNLWNPETGFWKQASELDGYYRQRGRWGLGDGIAVSAVGGFNGSALVLVSNGTVAAGELWAFDPKAEEDTTDRKIGTVGFEPTKLRCLNKICVVTNQVSDTITTIKWLGPSNTPVIVGTQEIGRVPLGLSLIHNPNGEGVWALTVGFEDNSYSVTEIDGDAMVTKNTTKTLEDCLEPSAAHFTSGEGTHVMITCSGDSKVIIIPR